MIYRTISEVPKPPRLKLVRNDYVNLAVIGLTAAIGSAVVLRKLFEVFHAWELFPCLLVAYFVVGLIYLSMEDSAREDHYDSLLRQAERDVMSETLSLLGVNLNGPEWVIIVAHDGGPYSFSVDSINLTWKESDRYGVHFTRPEATLDEGEITVWYGGEVTIYCPDPMDPPAWWPTGFRRQVA